MIERIVCATSFIILSSFACLSALSETFDSSDLTGVWYAHKVVSGDNPPDEPRWGYGKFTFNHLGTYSVSGWSSSGSVPIKTTGSLLVDSRGIVTVASEPLIHGVMNEGKNMVVLVDGNSKGNGLVILNKRASKVPFATGNLSGKWYGHHVVTGDVDNGDDPRWGYGTVNIASTGNYIATWNSPTRKNQITQGTIQIDNMGLLRLNNDVLTHGVMSDDRKLLVFIDGSAETKGNAISVFFKRASGVGFSTGDLEGDWCGHHIVSGDLPSDDPRWGYGEADINSSGSYIVNWTSPTQSNENTQGMMQINSEGIIGINNEVLVHGVMSDDKNQIVFIDGSSSSSGNALTHLTRCTLLKFSPGLPLLLLD